VAREPRKITVKRGSEFERLLAEVGATPASANTRTPAVAGNRPNGAAVSGDVTVGVDLGTMAG
jgi:hypothetical protein